MATVLEAMSSRLFSVCPETPAVEAVRLAAEARVRHLLVLERGELVGVLCTCDLSDAPAGAFVSAHMSSPVLTASTLESLDEVAVRMRQAGIGCLPVLDGAGETVGVISRGDLRRAGILVEQRRCNACGSRRHVQRLPEMGFVSFCAECAASVRADALEVSDLGDGD